MSTIRELSQFEAGRLHFAFMAHKFADTLLSDYTREDHAEVMEEVRSWRGMRDEALAAVGLPSFDEIVKTATA